MSAIIHRCSVVINVVINVGSKTFAAKTFKSSGIKCIRDGPDGVEVILWDCGSQEPGSNPGPGPFCFLPAFLVAVFVVN